MDVENTSSEGVIDIKVENESDSELDLYADHVIKEELVIGPVVLQAVVNTAYRPEDVPAPKKPKLETIDEETDQVKPQKGMNEDNTERIINNEHANCYELRKCNQTPGTPENVFICNECGKQFPIQFKLAKHVRCHTKKLSCPHCDYKCKDKCTLSGHIRIHTGEKPYSCSDCDFKSRLKNGLTKHLRTHTGEKPYSCSYCDYKSVEKVTLSRHLRTHTGEKPYSCFHCDFKCSLKTTLSRHLRAHTGEKPYSCSHCDHKCIQKSSLTIHLRTHTGEKPYSCYYCDYKCSEKGTLTRHLHTHTVESQL